jgi:phytoene synthase
MRLQWWRDALERLRAGGDIAHGVAGPLGQAIARHRLPSQAFERLIDARETDLDRTPPMDMAALLAYAEATSAPLLELAARIAVSGETLTDDAVRAARLVGTAWALTGLLRAVPFHARQRRLYLPADLLAAANVRSARLFDLKPEPGFTEVTRAIAREAEQLLSEARPLLRRLPRGIRAPFLLAPLAKIHLTDLRRDGWDSFALEGRQHPLMIARLAARAATGWY